VRRIGLLVLATTAVAAADSRVAIKAVDDLVPARSKDGKRLALPIESVVDTGSQRHSYSYVIVDVGKAKGKPYALATVEGSDDPAKALAKSAPAVNKLLADGGFAALTFAKGTDLAPGLTLDAKVTGSSITITALGNGKPVGSVTSKDRGTPELLGAVLVRGKPAYAYAQLRWEHSTDGAVYTDDGWVVIPLKQVP
jgi:hypothetical protein